MKCIVFGGGGFIGSTVTDRLLQDDHEITIFERPETEPHRIFMAHEKVEWITGDFQNNRDVNEAVKGADVVLHLVSMTLPKGSNDDPIYDIQSNLISSLQLLHAMVTQEVGKIIFISSGGTVYGMPEYLPINETHPTNPIVSYGIVKLAIEKYICMFKRLYGIKSIILRVSNPYGERQCIEQAQGIVGVFLRNILCGIPIEIWGNGSVIRDYIHVRDVAEAIARGLEYQGDKSVFNIGSGIGVSSKELISVFESVLKKTINCKYLPGRSFDVPANILNCELALDELHWVPKIDLCGGIEQTARWMEEELIKLT